MKKFLAVLVVLILSYFILYKMYIPRVSAFGCFDDCFNFAAGYFLNHNKVLYSDIFYNHQMLPAYISAVIQNVSHPVNIFDLVLRHRQLVLLVGFIFNLLLILKFGRPAFLFFVFFEISKFYIFGDRFLGEGLLVYPLLYLFFVSFKKLKSEKINNFDIFLSSVFSWLIIFLREPLAPISLILFLFILFPFRNLSKFKVASILLFIFLTTISLLSVNLKDYYFSLVTVNRNLLVQNFSDLLNVIFYPVYIFTASKWNIFRILLIGVDILFISSLMILFFKKKYKLLLIFIPLILTNIRIVEPGRLFYESFHMVPFYAIFLSATFLLIEEVKKYNKKFWGVLLAASLFLFLNYVISPHVFFKEKVNQHEEFFTNYSNILQIGEVVKKLSNPKDTLFVDGYDEVIYWVAQRPSSYKYSMYTSLMPKFSLYRDERFNMFRNNPPEFYYGSCPKELNPQKLMPTKFTPMYTRLNSFSKPSCIFVKKDKVKDITEAQWKAAKEFGYELPVDNLKNF